MTSKSLLFSCVIALCFTINISAINIAPTVNAGKDSSLRLPSPDITYSLWGSVTDDSLINVPTLWTQIGGSTTGCKIQDSSVSRSSLLVTAKGTYTFKLTADDGQFKVSDTVKITVIDSLPFLVINPKAGAQIKIGDTCTITWQYEPLSAGLQVFLSINNGKDFFEIGDARIKANTWIWQVSDTLPVSSQCRIKITKYSLPSRNTISETFSLIKGSSIKYPTRSSQIRLQPSATSDNTYNINGRSLSEKSTPSHKSGIILTPSKGIKSIILE